MGYVSSRRYDVFLSYARIDNEPTPDRWVSQFHSYLLSALKQALGSPDVAIFFDLELDNFKQLDDIIAAAHNSAVFLAVGSRAWVQRDWTLKEVAEFARLNEDPSLRFAVEIKPLLANQEYPPELISHNRRPLYWPRDYGSETPVPLSSSYEPQRFFAEIHAIAEQIARRLMEFESASRAPRAALPTPARAEPTVDPTTPQAGRTVIVALAEDMDRRSSELASYLRQYGILVRDAGEHPRGARDFIAALEQDIEPGAIFVQLLGTGSRSPPDLPEGFARFQLRAAMEHGLHVMQWRSPKLDLEDIDDPDQLTLITGERVICSSIQDFKDEVRNLALAPPPPKAQPAEASSSHETIVFIDACEADREKAIEIQKQFKNAEFIVSIPERSQSTSAREFLSAQEEMLVDCDVLVFLYGDVQPEWVSAQLRLFTRVRKGKTQPRIAAIYNGPPKPKEMLTTSIPRIRDLDGGEHWDMAPIQQLIDELTK